jgi:hypothetical protein
MQLGTQNLIKVITGGMDECNSLVRCADQEAIIGSQRSKGMTVCGDLSLGIGAFE